MKHWAGDLIGQPYRDGGQDCWWLVCEILRRAFRLPVPPGSAPAGVRAVRQALVALDLRKTRGPVLPQQFDVLFGRDLNGERHVMILVQWAEGLQATHATRRAGVIREPISVALQQMTGIETWRRQCSP